MKTAGLDALRDDLYEAATMAEAAAMALGRLACDADLGPCRCESRTGDDDRPELEEAIELYERPLGVERGEWRPPDTGCYRAHAARVWRERAERLDRAADALAEL